MAKLGTAKKPIRFRVQSEERLKLAEMILVPAEAERNIKSAVCLEKTLA